MTTYNITSEVIDESVVYGPYPSPDDSAWIKVKLNSVVINIATQQAMFNDDVTVLVERRISSGDPWQHYGHCVWRGYTEAYGSRDEVSNYAEFWVAIGEDGWQYQVTLTTDATDEIFGEIEFDTVASRIAPDTGSNGVGIADARYFRIQGPGGHGVCSAIEVSSPTLHKRNDNCTMLFVTTEGQINFDYPSYVGICAVSLSGTSTGDHSVVKWGGESGTELGLSYSAGNGCYITSRYWTLVNPSTDGYVWYRAVPDDIDAWLAGGEEGEIRDLSPIPTGTYAVLALNNTKQSDPIGGTWRSTAIQSPSHVPDITDLASTDGEIVFTGSLTTSPGQLCIGTAGALYNPQDELAPGEDLTWTFPSGWEEIVQENLIWDAGQSDEWDQAIAWKAADTGDNSTATGASLQTEFWPGYNDGWGVYAFASAVAFAETKYVHLVVVETPADPGDRPSASQIRAGQDGFGSAAPYYTKRGPDADGTVRYDADSIDGFDEFTDCTFCFVYDNEGTPTYLEKTTAQGIYCVAVENPGTSALYPSAAQIKAGTDYYDEGALFAGAVTYPTISGTEQFGAFTGAPLDTILVLGFVTGDEDPIYEVVQTLALPTIDGDITISLVADGGFAYNQHPSIGGDITVTLTPASGADYSRHASLSGDIDISINPAAGMVVNRHYSADGSVQVTFSPTADMAYHAPGSILGDITLSLSPAAQTSYAQHKSLVGAVTVSISSAASMSYTEATQSINGDVTIQIGVSGGMDHTINASLTGAVTLQVTAGAGMAYNAAEQASLAIHGIFVRPAINGAVLTRPSLSGQISIPH